MTQPTTLTGMLELLRTPSTITRSRLRIFSDLRDNDYHAFWSYWVQIPTDGRIRIITLMNEISEDNLELNFRSIMRWALGDEVDEIRQRAIDGLSEEDHPRIIRPLLERLQHDTSPVVRSHAALALAKFTTLISYGELSTDISTEIIETLHRELDTNRHITDVYRRILEALGAVSDQRVVDALNDAWQSDNQQLRESALVAMGRSADTQWLPIIRSALRHPSAAIRFEAANACAEYGDVAAAFVPQLIDLCSEDDSEVAAAAIHALGQIGDDRSIKALNQLAKSRDATKREAAMTALEEHEGSDDIFGGWRPGTRKRDEDAYFYDEDDE